MCKPKPLQRMENPCNNFLFWGTQHSCYELRSGRWIIKGIVWESIYRDSKAYAFILVDWSRNILRCLRHQMERRSVTQSLNSQKRNKIKRGIQETHNHQTSYFVAVIKELICSCRWMQEELPWMEEDTLPRFATAVAVPRAMNDSCNQLFSANVMCFQWCN